ncbi:MAG: alpha-mannosidase [Clostridia bacterium]|nr:alpha-mannosidase [Clostridia bacterium]
MDKTLYLISNAHLDPVWQWEWEEGAAAAVSTFRVAAGFCEQFDGYIFCHNEAALYEWVEEYEPALFERIRKLVDEGRWVIIGGWYIQPDCNMPAGETFVRQAVYGRKYFTEKFGVKPTVANNFDSFGHSRGLVQILAKCGYKYYIHCRPGDVPELPDRYRWIGYDGSEIIGEKQRSGYGTGLGTAHMKAADMLAGLPDGGSGICLWGVGDHGGGASQQDLDALEKLIDDARKNGDTVKHASPYEYFEKIDREKLTVWESGMNPWAVGCYTSQARLKSAYRALEDAYYQTEKMCMLARQAGVDYPSGKLAEAERTMLFATFHDYLPGSSVEPVEEMGLRQLGGATDTLTKLRARALFAMCSGLRKAGPDEIPVVVFNPNPYPVEGIFECEFMLWDQGWSEIVKKPHLYTLDGKEIPCQAEKELSNIPIDWRKRIAFKAEAAPSSVTMFVCKFEDAKKEPVATLPETGGRFEFDNGALHVEISRESGLIESIKVNGREQLSGGAFRLDVIDDNCDPWGMTTHSYRNTIGAFRLATPEETAAFCAVMPPLAPVRVIENGNVRVVVEALFCYGDSKALVRYSLPREGSAIDVSVRLQMYEKQKMIKLVIPANGLERVTGQTPYGREILRQDGDETVSQRYKHIRHKNGELLFIGRQTYGANIEQDEFRVSLVRTAAYTAHPLGDRKILPSDRFMPHIDIGTSIFSFRLIAGENLMDKAERLTQAYCEQPFAMSFFPSGQGERPKPGLLMEGDECIVLSAYKQYSYGEGDVVRLFNPTDKKRSVTLRFTDFSEKVDVAPFSFDTFLVKGGSLRPIPADECEGQYKT